ncbi:SseB family protein [Streptomyces sp. NPDC050448]|uniref:SseB family protein n=1 Tax=Streptomyces sp. NPDC050448 TaxID=3155404 RepID=UPI00341E2BDD
MGFDEERALLRAGASATPDPMTEARASAAARLSKFRSSIVLVPLDERGGLWTAALGGLDWICAFSDEETLARFAEARDEAGQEWPYQRVIGARLLDEVISALDFPCGVALDAAGPEGTVFPPVRGIVPSSVALDDRGAAA